MAVYNTDPSYYKRPELVVGMRIGSTTVIGVHNKTYTAQCDCGETLNRDKKANIWPLRCGICARAMRSKDNGPSKLSKDGVGQRANTADESKMIKDFLNDKNK